MERETKQKNNRRLTGVVVSDKMDKTCVVAVARLKKHSQYEKFFKATTRFKAHDEQNAYHTGDTVVIEESRPMSRDKRWVVVELVKAAQKAASAGAKEAQAEESEA